ncbi:MAG: class D beta-lactamase [Leptolyngbya sp. SIOISBB]|nr:class D beta-lactamase [Leptolyngbya sp. SIOISBB]
MNPVARLISLMALSGCCLVLSGKIALAEATLQTLNPSISQAIDQENTHFSKHFEDLDIEGSIVIFDLNQNLIYQHNPDRNDTAFLPASTFKIPNSLIALETQVIENDVSVLTWDGIVRSYPVWNQDLNIRLAFEFSAVWFYQVLARRIGHERMQEWVATIDYGNENIGSVEEIDSFWLNGELRITPQEQIQFLQRLYTDELPFSESTIATVKDIMIVEQTPDYTIRAKTGWALAGNVGWYVGYLEQNDNVYFFATNIDIQDESDLPARQAITRRCLASLNLL